MGGPVPDLVTTLLDLAGLLAVVLAVALALAVVSVPVAVGAAGVLLFGASWLIDRRRGSS